MADDKKIIFSMTGVTKTFKSANTPVLKNIYLSFYYGAKIGILGLNGSGKSTLLKIIAGIDKNYQGEVTSDKEFTTGYLEQEPQLDPEKTVLEVVKEGAAETVAILDEYNSGIQITQVQTQKADPPDQVIDAFRDVQAARADMERSKNEAEAYANDVIPRARGEAQKILQAAEAYKKEVVAKAEGEASRFISIYSEYAKAKQVTQERMYLETMEKVLADINKVIIDKKSGGVVPYLPLPELSKKATN